MGGFIKSRQAKFSDIVSQILQDRAVDLLTTSNMNINLISGYSDSPNFIRSFKKWTGFTACKYRESMMLLHYNINIIGKLCYPKIKTTISIFSKTVGLFYSGIISITYISKGYLKKK
ncbi:helix-turn-helix domain-containing protein [Aquimarina algiphila]|uniref:helix-turn-helix domain-containing protein n=1 Tax=Aquimarina algiphila TaxID=2047982 RepID=UPI00232B1472|nr:AraC family transcriptional regulator [Aquimarina algiphila]